MKIIIQSYSTTGVRSHNEDAMDHINNLDESNKTNIKILYVGVYDGHGGGNISKCLVDKDKINLSKYFCSLTSPIATRLCSNKTFNQKIIVPLFGRIQEKLKNFYIHSNTMGSTALIALIYPRGEKQNRFALKVINLGDSRAVMCNEYNIGVPLTLDHKPHLICEKDRIKQIGGKLEYSDGDDPRINGMSVSRSFGDLDNNYISQVPDVFDYNLSGEKFIIMACDGVWDVLNNQDAVDYVIDKFNELKLKKKSLANLKSKSETNLAQKLGDYAIAKGSQDNISVSVIFFTDNFI